MKRTAYIVLLLALIFTFTSAAMAASETSAGLTLEEAQKQALVNSRQAVIDDLEIKAKETALKQVKEDADMTGDTYGADAVLSARINKEVKPMQAEAALAVAKRAKKDNSEQLKLDVNSAFLDIFLAQKELENANKKLDFAKERLTMAETRYAAKTITEDDLKTAQYNVETKQLDVYSVQEKLKTLDMQLKNLLNQPLDGDVLAIAGKIELQNLAEIDINKVVADYLETDTNTFKAAEAYKAVKKTMDLTEALFKAGDKTYDDNRTGLETASRDYADAKSSREVNIRNTYNDLLSLKDAADLSANYVILAGQKLNNVNIRYDKGLVSKDAYMAEQENYLDAEYANYKAINGFNTKKAEFIYITRPD